MPHSTDIIPIIKQNIFSHFPMLKKILFANCVIPNTTARIVSNIVCFILSSPIYHINPMRVHIHSLLCVYNYHNISFFQSVFSVHQPIYLMCHYLQESLYFLFSNSVIRIALKFNKSRPFFFASPQSFFNFSFFFQVFQFLFWMILIH